MAKEQAKPAKLREVSWAEIVQVIDDLEGIILFAEHTTDEQEERVLRHADEVILKLKAIESSEAREAEANAG